MLSLTEPMLMICAVTVLVAHAPQLLDAQSIDVSSAKAAFKQAQQLSEKDGGRLWKQSLYGPIIFASPVSHEAVANQPGESGVLHAVDDVWTGTLPPNIVIANTAFWWAGKHWTMVMWPLPSNRLPRGKLLAHEMYHRLQDELHLPANNPQNPQLNSLEGRYWLQLEWKALALALISNGAAQNQAIVDALAFRSRRHALLPGTAEHERELEMNEGLAEYTGYALYAPDAASARWRLVSDLVSPQTQTFVRSFAYLSGPAYGLLLDERTRSWRFALTSQSDLATLLRATIAQSKSQVPVQQRALQYGASALRLIEEDRAAETAAQLSRYRHAFVEGPVMTLPNVGHFDFGFDPNTVVPLPGSGNVYPTMRISDDWGSIQIENGVLLNENYTLAIVIAPSKAGGHHIEGDGWKLDLNPGWHIGPGPRTGDLAVIKGD